jgi:hypothetical protein
LQPESKNTPRELKKVQDRYNLIMKDITAEGRDIMKDITAEGRDQTDRKM